MGGGGVELSAAFLQGREMFLSGKCAALPGVNRFPGLAGLYGGSWPWQ